MFIVNTLSKAKRLRGNPNNISPIIFFLTFADIFTWGTYNIVMSLAALYLAQNMPGEDIVRMVTVGVAIRFITRGLLQIPFGLIADKIKKNFDEIIFVGVGIILMSAAIIGLTFVTTANQYYFIEVIMGAGASLNLVNWRKLFATNLHKDTEGVSYAIYDTAISFSIALFTFISGLVASSGEDYFDLVMRLSGVIMFLSNVWIMVIYINEKHRFEDIHNDEDS